jgi:deazaflavin-dependent oxidoreductase (nitroreductase family)
MKDRVDLGRMAFKYINIWMVFLWRLGLGKLLNVWPEWFGKYMVITHHGRKSGRNYRTPVNYSELNGDIYCTAGFGRNTEWYRNILTNPQVEIWLPDGWYVGSAQEIVIDNESLPILRSVISNSGFVAWLLGINPEKIPDDQLREMCKDYRLIQIRRAAPRTGADGPGDLAWLWPILLTGLLVMKSGKRKK